MARQVFATSSAGNACLDSGPFSDLRPVPVETLDEVFDHQTLPDFICSKSELFEEAKTALLHIDMVNMERGRLLLDLPVLQGRLRTAVLDYMRTSAVRKLVVTDFGTYCQIRLSAYYAEVTGRQPDFVRETGYRFYAKMSSEESAAIPSVYAQSGLPRIFSRD